MPAVLALVLTLLLIFLLFWRESRQPTEVSSAIWIPILWFLFTGSRFPSQWLDIMGLHLGDASYEDGSPLDAVAFFGLMVAGLYVLKRRSVSLSEFVRNNRWLTIFLLYCLVAVVWSDFPFVAFKRWIKVLGHPIMALVVLTDPDPKQAFSTLMKRSAYVLVLLSIVFIKYFPEFSRSFDPWTGLGSNCGVAITKNGLGAICMIFGLFFFWNLLEARKLRNFRARRTEFISDIAFLGLILWLLKLSSSATSLACLVIGMLTIWVLDRRFISKRLVGTYVVLTILAIAVAEPLFGIYSGVLHVLGRNGTLTDRTQVWQDTLALQPDPIFGAGFESFWLGKRLDKLWQTRWWQPNQAHDGYIETYLNLGWIGVVVLAGMIIGTFGKIKRALLRDFQFARLRLAFLFAILAYNYTEAAFKGVHVVWTVFYLIAVDYPGVGTSRSRRLARTVPRKDEETALSRLEKCSVA